MKRSRKILGSIVVVLALALGAGLLVLSHDGPCGSAPPLTAGAASMRAIQYRCYGGPEVLKVETIAKPVPAADEVLVKVNSAGVNPLDWHYMRGEPYFMRMEAGIGVPKSTAMGVDFAGIVEAVGSDVKNFVPGDEVFGGRNGALGEYVVVRESRNVVKKPVGVTFEQAAALPIAGITALQALRDQAQVKPGHKVLVNGASGGVGTFAVQLAKLMGAEVTGVSSTRNVELVRGLGVDHVIDYKNENYTAGAVKYDAIIDTVGSQTLSANRGVLTEHGVYVMVGGSDGGKFLGPMTTALKAMAYDRFVGQQFKFFLAELNPADLGYLVNLVAEGKLKAVIDTHYPLDEAAAAVAHVEEGHTRGKVIVDIQ